MTTPRLAEDRYARLALAFLCRPNVIHDGTGFGASALKFVDGRLGQRRRTAICAWLPTHRGLIEDLELGHDVADVSAPRSALGSN